MLVKNASKAFWISVDKQYLPILKKYQQEKASFYLGLHWRFIGGVDKIANLPFPMYVRKSQETPHLFVKEWLQFNRQRLSSTAIASSIEPEDIWFFEVKVMQIKNLSK